MITGNRRQMFTRRNTSALKVILPCLIFLGAACSRMDSRGGSSPAGRLNNSFSSAEQLTEGFLEALKDGDFQTMELIAADREEFERLLWPHLPASRPDTNLTPEFVWRQSQIKSLSSLRATMSRYKGTDIDLVRVELSGEVRDYGELRLFMEPEVVVAMDGVEKRVKLFGSMMLLDGEYKIYSYSL